MSSQVSAIIFLFHKKGRTTNSRYGQFIRPDKSPHPEAQDLHLWLGRELSIEEFNEQLPKAIKSVLTTDPVACKIIVRPGEEAEAGSAEALEALKKEHAEAVEAMQAGVNAFTADVNGKLEAAQAEIEARDARIAELCAELEVFKLPPETQPAEEAPDVSESTESQEPPQAAPMGEAEAPAAEGAPATPVASPTPATPSKAAGKKKK